MRRVPTVVLGLLLVASCHPAVRNPPQGVAKRPAPPSSEVADAGAVAADAAPDPLGLGDYDYQGRGRPLPPAELPDEAVVAAAQAVMAEAKGPTKRPAGQWKAWDKKTPPKYLDKVTEHLGLTAPEKKLLEQNGFVVPLRHRVPSYGVALHEVHRQELPLYVSADAVMQSIFLSHEDLMLQTETGLASELATVLEKMHDALVTNEKQYHPDVAKDADVYLSVARGLLGTDPKDLGKLGGEFEPIVSKAEEAKGIGQVVLFGRPRNVDFSFYQPRGMYERTALHQYFRAMVWLTRLELNVSSRGAASSAPSLEPKETPREATLALVLADLTQRAQVTSDIAKMERFYRTMAGRREDIPLDELVKMKKGIPLDDPEAAAKALRAQVGERFPRTVNQHVRTYWAERLPAIATFFGVGIVPDAGAISALTSKGQPRVVRAPEVAFSLGHDRARRYAGADLTAVQLETSQKIMTRAPRGPDLYSTWLGAVRSLADKPHGTVPTFFSTDAFADTRVASAITSYGQIRHAYVLHAVQVYEEGGCVIPDAYVDPALPVFDAILAYADRLEAEKTVFAESADVAGYVSRVRTFVGSLRAIAEDELAGRALSPTQLSFLRMVAEYIPAGRGYTAHTPGRFNGWYPHLYSQKVSAFEDASFAADFYTAPFNGVVSFAGARQPRLGIFVVDASGEPRVMVGPVTRGLDRVVPIGRLRTDNDEARPGQNDDARVAPFETSYTVRRPQRAAIEVSSDDGSVSIDTKAFDGEVTVERYDEHDDTIASVRVRLKKDDQQTVRLATPANRESRGVRLRLANGTVQHDVYHPWGTSDD